MATRTAEEKIRKSKYMKRFPAFLDLKDRRVVIAGGGEAAAQKGRLLAAAGADLLFVAETFDAELVREFSTTAGFLERPARDADFAGAIVVVVAESDSVLAEELATAARLTGALVNVVDRPDLSDFNTPSIVDRGDVVVAISTEGSAPVLGRKIRKTIEALLPSRIGALAAFARAFRPSVAGTIAPQDRRQFWECFFDGPIAARFLAGDESGARESMIAAINRQPKEKKEGVVHIVGAGPGDPELLTMKAHRLLQSADVILYDKLVSQEVLSLARRDARRVFVGKSKANHSVPQKDISALLVQLASEGANVVRLKGGDPFIFGRGGEELDVVRAAGLPVFVTPGVTAAIGCAASSSMPLTHRDHSQAVTFVTGHAKGESDPDIDWSALAALGHTLVVYMGVGKAANISSNLVQHGLQASTPVAVIENGTLEDERVIKGALGNLSDLIASNAVVGPALLVIGDVAALATARDAAVFRTEIEKRSAA